MRIVLLSILAQLIFCTEDYYNFLGVTKQSTEREIRKAFKKKALVLHPDKNPDDPEAHSNFLKLNRIYEVLKDEELRKKYDLYGEKGLDSKSQGNNYHSWNYYHDNFGIYDDDAEIITLNKADFDQSVTGSDIWFINFYHPMCSHCHTLAPIWRRLAQELYGVVRIGAVNCDDTYHLCSSQGIRSYPTLVAYPGRTTFHGPKEYDELLSFILGRLDQSPTFSLTEKGWTDEVKKCQNMPWILISNLYEGIDAEFVTLRTKLKAIFKGMLCLGEIHCYSHSKLCKKLKLEEGIYFYQSYEEILKLKDGKIIDSKDTQEFTRRILHFLPDIQKLSFMEYKDIQAKLLRENIESSSLVLFAGESDEENLEIRKLPALLPSFSIGKVLCSELQTECDELFIAKTPTFILFKPGGGYEMHMGRILAHDIAVFAREGTLASRFQILTPKEFPGVLANEEPWFIDFFAPWCPPCKRLLPEFRKASRLVDFPMNFGTIDCTTHTELCHRFNIHQYPTTILYNKTKPYQYYGHPSASHIKDFVQDTLYPTVVILDEESFIEKITNKVLQETWIVDFFATWCHHCQEMAPEYRKFARLVSKLPNVFVASVDCAIHRSVCQKEGIKGYPSIRMFPSGHRGSEVNYQFNEWSRDAESFRRWLYSSLPSEVETLDDRSFESVLRSGDPWLVDFYAPWCGHCHVFAPEFDDIARELKGKLRFGKIDCDAYKWICKGAGIRAYPSVRFYEGISRNNGGRQDQRGVDLGTIDKEELLQQATRRLTPKATKPMRDEL